ncbi:MAG: SWIM zinc finger family protein [Kiritimatiellae bacterium]|nr:SWIM zinc finger family protein [Kiritimatiellia bacterium]
MPGKKRRKYAVRTPFRQKGGIRAQFSGHGRQLFHATCGRTWWSRRWIDALERFRLGARLGRGRSYAVGGQVAELQIEPGLVNAVVQGTEREPYRCFIRFRMVEGETKRRLLDGLRGNPMLVARLLVGDLPYEVEERFAEVGVPLFPRREDDIWSQCGCPDYVNPCKHLAAVYYLLGEAVAKNPLLLLAVRGIGREELAGCGNAVPETVVPSVAEKGGPWTADAFYGAARTTPGDDAASGKPAEGEPAPLLARLGPLPFWRGQERFMPALETVYTRAAPRGFAAWTGETLDLRREDEKIVVTGAPLRQMPAKLRTDSSWF